MTAEQLARHVQRMRRAQQRTVASPKSHELTREARTLEYAVDQMIQEILNEAEMAGQTRDREPKPGDAEHTDPKAEKKE